MNSTPQSYQRENNEITLLDALKVCFRFKYLILAITLIVTILGTLFIQVIYNASNKYYYSNFALYYTDVPAVVNTDVDFDFTSQTVIDRLKANEDLEGMNFDDLVLSNMGLSFDQSIVTDENRVQYANFPYARDAVYYTWVGSPNTIQSEEQAVAYVNALADSAIVLTREKISSLRFDSYLSQVGNSESFDREISYLQSQASMIVSNYETLISKYGANLYVSNNDTLKNKVDEIKIYIAKISFEDISDTIERNSYVKFLPNYDDEGNIVNYKADDRYKANVRESIKAIEEQLNEIKPLYQEAVQKEANPGSNSEINNYWVNRLETLTTQKTELERKLERLNNCVTKMDTAVSATDEYFAETAEVRQDLAECFDYLTDVLEEYREDLLYIYDLECRIIFEDSRMVVTTGGVGLLTSLVLTFAVGFILSLAAVFVVNMFMKARNELAQERLQEESDKAKEEKE